MDSWLNTLGVVASSLATLYLALLIPAPRVCLRIAQLIGGWAVSLAGLFFMCALGAFLAKQAVLAQTAKDFAITYGTASEDRWVLDKIAAAVDPLLGQMLTLAGISVAAVLVSAGAFLISKMVIEDRTKNGSPQ